MTFLTNPSYNPLTGSNNIVEQDPLDQHFTNQIVNIELVDIAAATHYYPSANGFLMDGYKDFSLTGVLDDTDGTLSIGIEVTNDEDPATADWVPANGYADHVSGGSVAQTWSVTSADLDFAISYNNANFKWLRIVVVASGATNSIIIKGRRKAL